MEGGREREGGRNRKKWSGGKGERKKGGKERE